MKKLFRAVSVLLMLTLAVSPALAAACATSCGLFALQSAAMDSAMSSLQSMEPMPSNSAMSNSAMSMDHCQQMPSDDQTSSMNPKANLSQQANTDQPSNQYSSTPDQHPHSTDHKNCTMAGCHFSQFTPDVATCNTIVIDNTSSTLPRSNVIGVSAEQSPPIKPPA